MIKLPSKTPSKLSGFLSLDAAYPLPNKKKLGISRFLTRFEKNWLKSWATSDSLETNSSFSTKVMFSLDFNFSERKGLTICQNFLLSMISFSLRLAKYFWNIKRGVTRE